MEHPEKFSKVLTSCIITVGSIFLSIGILGYLAFGEKVETVIFLNLPQDPITNTVQFLYVLAIILSFPLTIYPAMRITEQGTFI
jgi:proton-coupled amino acid transporter